MIPAASYTDACRAAAAFLRTDLDALGDDAASIAGLTSVARVLEAAATGADATKLRERIGEMADALLGMKRDDELVEQVTAEVTAAHQVTIAKADQYLFRAECSCGEKGEPKVARQTARNDGQSHIGGIVQSTLAERRRQAAEPVPA